MKPFVWVGAIIGAFASIALIFILASTYPEDICTARTSKDFMEGGATCSEHKTVRIIKGTEEYGYLYESKCARFFAKPAFDRVGGIVGSNYVGCAIFQ